MLSGMDWAAMRSALRDERERRIGSRARLAERAAELGDESLDESTIYRIETDAAYFPGMETFVRLVEAIPGLTLSELFLRIESVTLPVTGADQRSRATEGGSDVPASPERDRLSRLEADVDALKTQFGNVQTLARSIVREVFVVTREGRATPTRQSKRRRTDRKVG